MDVTKIKVVAMDLDGTLTQHKQPMTPQVREALKALQKNIHGLKQDCKPWIFVFVTCGSIWGVLC